MNVTPFVAEVDGDGFEYNKLIDEFGSLPITEELLESLGEEIPIHQFLRRGIFFSHRDLNQVVQKLKEKNSDRPFYLYTGRGPSSESLHLGHLVPFMFTKYLQDVLKVPVVIQITDDEKFLFKKHSQSEIDGMAKENIMDIIACGFDKDNTFIFRNTEFIGSLYHNVLRIQKHTTLNTVKGTFGFTDSSNIGQISFPAIQSAPAIPSTFQDLFLGINVKDLRAIIPCAIDQDSYFRLTRDLARKLKFKKPILIHSKFMPSLRGVNAKMSSSDKDSVIFVSDSTKQIRKKINKAFSGGQELLEDHRRLGGDPAKDVAFHLLELFLEDDEELAKAESEFKSGEMSCGEIKKKAISAVCGIIDEFKERRSKITEEIYDRFTTSHPLIFQ